MRSIATLIINALLVVNPVTAAYTQLAADYTPANFFDGFDFFTGRDPTNGYVKYVPNSYASSYRYRANQKCEL